jgi:membrane associated rhomboid family serine protease
MTPWVKRLLIANLAVFVLTSYEPAFGNILAFYPRAILFQPWGVFTYMFVHAGFRHIFWNMLLLFFFGPRLERHMGGKYFIRLYLLSGLGGAAFSFLFAPLAGVVGASGAIFGVLLGFAYFWPRERIYIYFIIPVEARILVGLAAAISLFSGISGSASGTAHFAHLGGFAAGYAYLRWRKKRYMNQWSSVPTPKAAMEKAVSRVDEKEAKRRWSSIRLDELHELNRDEVARILKKLEESGARSLTFDERSLLDRFSARH